MQRAGMVAAAVVAGMMSAAAWGGDAAQVVDEPVLERPTLRCLGVYWIVGGDDDADAEVGVEYRRAGESEWREGYPLFRVERGAPERSKWTPRVKTPEKGWLFAGSIVGFAEGTAHEIRLVLKDPDGGGTTRTIAARTREEPKAPADAAVYHVVPGEGGGAGTEADPFRGLAAAQANARPGSVFLVHAGVYTGVFQVRRSGEPGRPIVWRGAGDGAAVIDAQGAARKRPGRAVSASEVRDVWLENLVIRNAEWGIVAHDSSRIVVRGCRIDGVDYGITATRDAHGTMEDFFIADNDIEGPSTWPRTQGIENARGIQITGAGHVICYNRVRGFADAIDTFPSSRCEAIDIHNNDIYEMTDDGIEMDYSFRNTRCFENRLTNVYQGISVQPVYGGPVYVFRNAMYNIGLETFKMHNEPSGALFFHNTSVKAGMPLVLYTSEPVRHCITRNNLFVGTEGNYAFECLPPMERCDFDYDGFAGEWKQFLKWNGVRYNTIELAWKNAPVYEQAAQVQTEGLFASGARAPADAKGKAQAAPDLRLAATSGAVDAGMRLPGFGDRYQGRGADLGAYEVGTAPPHYGPRQDVVEEAR